jgi:multidrug efflux pump subunit AcrA (membrane-fusion protein)
VGQGQGPGPTPVVVAPIEERSVPASLRLVGTTLADRTSVVASEVAGLVARWTVEEGDFVRSGAVLCELDDATARMRLSEAQGRLASLRANLEELENGTRPEELKRIEASAAEAQAIFDKWKLEHQRVSELFAQQRSNLKEMNDTEMDFLAAQRRLAQAQAALEMACNGPRKEVIAAARAEVAGQAAVVQRLERDLDRTKIRAPFDGFVLVRRAELGEWIEIGGAACEMVAMEKIKVRVDVPESAVRFARAGAPATVEVEALERSFSAPIARVIPRAAPAARTFPLEIDLPNTDHALLPGMFVWAHVPSGPLGPRLMVNKDAIVVRGLSKQVFVVRAGVGGAQMAMPVPVSTGLEQEGQVEISAPDLKPGDLVVTRNNERLHGPTPVIPTPAAPERAAAPPGGPAAAGEPARQ